MKNILFYAILLSGSLALAQIPEVKDIRSQMTKGVQPGVEVFIPGANEDQVRDAIKDNTRKFRGDDDNIRRSDERFIDDAKVEALSENTVDIHYLIKEQKNGSTLQVYINMGSAFLSRDMDAIKYQYMSSLVSKIAVDATRLNYDEMIEEQEKVLSGFMDDRKDAMRDIERARKDIEDAKKEIAEKEREISELERKVSEQARTIAAQEGRVKELRDKKSKVRK